MSERDDHTEIARRAFMAGATAALGHEGYPQRLARDFESWWHGGRTAGASWEPQVPATAEIESALVDALEVELEDYQSATESWKAVHAAIDGLRNRDTEIARLREEVERLRAKVG